MSTTRETLASAEILKSAHDFAKSAKTWADLSNAIFDPFDGLLAGAFRTRDERTEFIKTPEYREIRRLINEAKKRTGLVEGAKPKKSGRFLTRIPASLHEALEREAKCEGVSLNQLVVSKLAVRLCDITSPKIKADPIVQAFLEYRDGYSSDKVVADPNLNRLFLNRARELGAEGSDFELNWVLMNVRKSGKLSVPTKTKRYSISDRDDFEFATEMAISYLQRKLTKERGIEISLDRIICDPQLAASFDELAVKLSPGHSALDYRWVVLGLRKARRLSKKHTGLTLPSFDYLGPTNGIRPSKLPKDQGLYIFEASDKHVFVGETDNLRNRLERHFDSAGGKEVVPDWLYDPGGNPIRLGIIPLGKVVHEARKELELGFIGTLKPALNYFQGRPRSVPFERRA